MTDMPILTPEQEQELSDLARSANDELESAGQDGANRAFNLGCTVSLLPAGILVLLTFILAKANWVVALVSILLLGVAILGFANYAAYTARTKTIDRIYQLNVFPQIERTLKGLDLPRPSFDHLASQILPEGAVLRNFLTLPHQVEVEEKGKLSLVERASHFIFRLRR